MYSVHDYLLLMYVLTKINYESLKIKKLKYILFKSRYYDINLSLEVKLTV